MATIEDAKSHWQQVRGGFKEEKGVRFAITGDGRGTAASNFFWNVDDRFTWVREHSDPDRPFVILNKGRVNRSYNVPVVLGFDDTEPQQEQILGVNYAALAPNTGGCAFGTGSHHDQHEFGGGDEVWIDSRLFIPGLVYPTNPPSMQLNIRPFIYFYKEWTRYAGGTPGTINLSEFKPREGYATYVLIALDPDADQIVYRTATHSSSSASWATIIEGDTGLGFDEIPRPSGNEYPLGAVLLEDDTTAIDWTTVDNLFDTRLHIGHSVERLIDRVDQIEGHLGAPPNVAGTGAATRSADDFKANAWAIQDKPIENSEPANGDSLTWSNTDGVWKPDGGSRSSWGNAISTMLALPGLRGLWPMSAVDSSGNAQDVSGHGHHLTYNGNPAYNAATLVPYIAFDGTGDYLDRTDEADLDITGGESYIGIPGLTFGGWFRFDNAAGGTAEFMIGKGDSAGDVNASYHLRRLVSGANGSVRFVIGDTSSSYTVDTANEAAATAWYFVVGRFNPSTEIAVWLNNNKDTNTTSIPATLINSTEAFSIGARAAAFDLLLTGRASLCFLCAAALSDTMINNLFQQTRHLFGV